MVCRCEAGRGGAFPEVGAVDHAMPIVEVVISPSKVGHEFPRSIAASRAVLRRAELRELREQTEHFCSHAPPIPSKLSVDDHTDLLAKAARVAWRRATPLVARCAAG